MQGDYNDTLCRIQVVMRNTILSCFNSKEHNIINNYGYEYILFKVKLLELSIR